MPDNLSDMMTDKERAFDTCLKLVGRIECTKVRIYNIIRDVGYGKLSADRALHQLVEDYHQLGVTAQAMSELADHIDELPEADTKADSRKDDDYDTGFYVVDMPEWKEVTRSRTRGKNHPMLTRRDLYNGRMDIAECNYAHEFMCNAFPSDDDPDRPSKDEWLDMKPHPFEVDEFLSEKLFPRNRQ